MSNPTPALKRHNHRVHPCKDDKKEELLKFLLEKNKDKKIIVVTATKTELTTTQENVSIVSDEELLAQPELKCNMIISFNLPLKAIKYMQRIAHTDTYALLLINPSEEKIIHPIETLIGRTIMQEDVEGFSEVREEEKQAQPTQKDFDPREERKQKFLSRDEKPEYKEKKPYSKDDRGERKPYSKDDRSNNKGDRKPWEKKERKESKYLGKDENGKAIFSGKSGDRNHSYDGTPKARPPRLTGKKISIKSLNKKDEE